MVRNEALPVTTQKLDTARELSDMATTIFSDMALLPSKNRGQDRDWKCEHLIFFTHALFHQCQMTLHSIVVPLFSGVPIEETIDLETRKKGAETVIHHADLFESLLEPYSNGQSDVTCIPPLVAHGAFITAVVFLTMEFSCPDRELQEESIMADTRKRRLATVSAVLRILNILRNYWRTLQHPVS